ncbi:MAG TPA: ATP-grasp domain-containing protein [Clostridia bacterium]|nr:ATP-grasp domain-containing protein [Clostridia bacterium]
MIYSIGLIIDKPNIEKNNTEVEHANEQKEITADRVYEILSKKYRTEKIISDEKIIDRLMKSDVDFVFNLSTGIRGESRQSQIPALLELLGIPYVGSGILAHSLALNKAVAKQVFQFHSVSTPPFQVFHTGKEELDQKLVFPLIVKPACEGSGFGIHKDSVVYNEEALYKKVGELLLHYQPPVIAEEFIEGREFTVGVIGNGVNKMILPIMEIDFKDIPEEYGRFYTFEVKTDFGEKTKYYCPAPLGKETEQAIKENVSRAFDALGCRDISRVDVRLRDGKPYIIEINSLPGLQPVYSDLPKMAEVAGMSYEDLILRILDEAIARTEGSKKYNS